MTPQNIIFDFFDISSSLSDMNSLTYRNKEHKESIAKSSFCLIASLTSRIEIIRKFFLFSIVQTKIIFGEKICTVLERFMNIFCNGF